MFENCLAKSLAPAGKGDCLRQCTLGQRNASDTVGHPRKIQGFKDQINAPIGFAQQIGFTLAQLDFAGGHRTCADFILYAPNGVIQRAI